MHTINNEISSVEIIKHTGDLEINADVSGEIILTDGNLTINGNVKGGAKISVDNSTPLIKMLHKLPTMPSSLRVDINTNNSQYFNNGDNVTCINNSYGKSITTSYSKSILKLLPDNFMPRISSPETAGTIKINGSVEDNVNIKSTNFKCEIDGNIGKHCTIVAPLGISAKVIGSDSIVIAEQGKVFADEIHEGAIISECEKIQINDITSSNEQRPTNTL